MANAEDMIERNKRLAAMQALLENKERTLGEANELVDLLVGNITVQGAAIIEMRNRQAIQQSAIETLADMIGAEEEAASKLIGFERPKLEVN